MYTINLCTLWHHGWDYLDYGIHRTGLLTEPTVDTFGHVDVVSCSSSATISSLFCLYCNGL